MSLSEWWQQKKLEMLQSQLGWLESRAKKCEDTHDEAGYRRAQELIAKTNADIEKLMGGCLGKQEGKV